MKGVKRLLILRAVVVCGILVSLAFANDVKGARTDMVDVSNHNGYMTTANFKDMRDNYGVKSVVTKLSEGTYYHDYTASNNIYTAQQAGLYINAYHFARYTTTQGAINEANYAVQCAKADGLPIGAVIVADVEASEQTGVSRAQNNANNKAFGNVIKQAGYRFDVYTMSSWLGYRMDVGAGSGWIASYPYNASGKNWYSDHHAWQWGSTYQFAGSYGNFDVSQQYDNFYTADQTPLVDPTRTITNNVTVKGNKWKAYPTYTSDGKTNEGTDVISGTSWVSHGINVIDGVPYYAIGNNVYLKQSATTNDGVITVNYLENYGVKSYNCKGVSQDTAKTFKGGTSWKFDEIKNIKGVGYAYRVSTDQYIPIKYAAGSGYKGGN